MARKKCIVPALIGVLMCFSPIVVHAAPEDIATVTYDKDLSLVTIVPNQEGVTTFSYKIDGKYPTYQYDKVMYFDETGKLIDTKKGMLNKPIFSKDTSTWIDVTKDKATIPPDAEYYEAMRSGDAELIIPYSEDNPDHIFYIPVQDSNSSVQVIVANNDETQTVKLDTNTTEKSFKAKVKSVSKDDSKEIVEVSGKNLSYVEYDGNRYDATDNKVKLVFNSNGSKDLVAYGVDDSEYKVLTYEVSDLEDLLADDMFTELKDTTLDNKAPVITVDKLPTKNQVEPLKFKVYTDEKCTITCNGETVTGTEMELTVDTNCQLLVSAVDMGGNSSEQSIEINCFASSEDEYTFDRDSFWKDNGSSNDDGVTSSGETTEADSLPKTGDAVPAIAFGMAALFISVGIILIRKKRS